MDKPLVNSLTGMLSYEEMLQAEVARLRQALASSYEALRAASQSAKNDRGVSASMNVLSQALGIKRG